MHPNRLLNLLARNAHQGAFKAEGNVIYLYDVIVGSDEEAAWFGGVSPQAFIAQLKGMTGPVALRINSPGGDVFAAKAICQAIREYPDPITATVDGLAASAASLVAVSADTCQMAPGSFLMIHKAWTVRMGNADDFTAAAALLGKVDVSLAETYAAKAQGVADDFAAMMAAETWITAVEAVELGLADVVIEATKKTGPDAAQARNRWDLSAYDNAPKADTVTITTTTTVTIEEDECDPEDPVVDPIDPAAPATPDQSFAAADRRARIHAVRMLQEIA